MFSVGNRGLFVRFCKSVWRPGGKVSSGRWSSRQLFGIQSQRRNRNATITDNL
jgi:hypothetical protein